MTVREHEQNKSFRNGVSAFDKKAMASRHEQKQFLYPSIKTGNEKMMDLSHCTPQEDVRDPLAILAAPKGTAPLRNQSPLQII